MKFISLIWFGSVCICFTSATEARVIGLQDWDGSFTSRSAQEESEVLRCEEACPGYSITVTYCDTENGKILESCKVKGCRYYHRCVDKTVSD